MFFRLRAVLLQKLSESEKNKRGFQPIAKTSTMSEMYCSILGPRKRSSDRAHALWMILTLVH